MKVKEVFRNIERYKGLIQNYQDYINYYNECLTDSNKLIEYIERPTEENLNIQKTKNISAPQEKIVIKKEIAKEKVKEEIEFFRNKRNDLFNKLYILEKSLVYLKKVNQEYEFVVVCRYLEKMKWSEIELNFNNKFRSPDCAIGYNSLNTKIVQAIKLMQEYADTYPFFKIDYTEKLKRFNVELM